VNVVRVELIALTTNRTQPGSFALILGEVDGQRRLPIIIGAYEAQAIALELERRQSHIQPQRPMTHDLFVNVLKELHVNIEQVLISHLKEGVFYAELHLLYNEKKKIIDARPSDAIALAVRVDAPIFVSEMVMKEVGITISEEELSPSPESPPSERLEKLLERLEKNLEEALKNEDYERAAQLRDEINAIKSKIKRESSSEEGPEETSKE
jgi:bifunctional DNase/RNase